MDAHDWDEFAATYAAIQQESTLPVETDVIAALATHYPLAIMSVGELAAGSGRYTLPLAQHARSVTAYDWSKQMLNEATRWLAQHHVTNVSYQQNDWEQLPSTPIADLIFVSQLPTLTAASLPHLNSLATRAVAINTQSGQKNRALADLAHHFGWPLPTFYQADPRRVTAYRRHLETQNIPYHQQAFTYQRQTLTTATELMQAFDRPFTLSQAAEAAAVLGVDNGNAPLSTTITYTFQLLDWRR
ncbi:class I SAM-dependent methyltransferase [Lacticaseibacillus sp. GG6-2]